MEFHLPNFKNFSHEHRGVFIAGILIILALAGSLYFYSAKKPDYRNLYDTLAVGNYADTIADAESLLIRNKDDVALIQILSAAYMSEGVVKNERKLYVDKAHALLLKSINDGHENPESYRLVGYGYFLLRDYTEAQKFYEKAANLDGESALIWADLGQVQEVRRNFIGANTSYDKALKIDKENPLANLGRLRQMMRDGKTDIAYSEAYFMLHNSVLTDRLALASLNQILGLLAAKKKDFSSAVLYLTESARLDPTSPVTLTSLALAMISDIPNHVMKSMEEETAVPKVLAEDALKIDPNYSYAWTTLIKIANLRRDNEGLVEYWKKLREALPKDTSISPLEQRTLANQYRTATSTSVTNVKIISIKKSSSTSDKLGITQSQSK